MTINTQPEHSPCVHNWVSPVWCRDFEVTVFSPTYYLLNYHFLVLLLGSDVNQTAIELQQKKIKWAYNKQI
jgi:hypothetical protein